MLSSKRCAVWLTWGVLSMTGSVAAETCGEIIRPAIIMQSGAQFTTEGHAPIGDLSFGTVLGLSASGTVCLDEKAGRIEPPEALLPASETSLRLRDLAVGAPRPRIGFFADRASLVDFLSRTSGQELKPVLEEAEETTQVWQIPVISTEIIKTSVGFVTIAEVAVPLSSEALSVWDRISTAEAAPPPLFVLDRRGHSRRFSEDLYQRLTDQLRASGNISNGISLVEIVAGEVWSLPHTAQMGNLPALEPLESGPDVALPRPPRPPGPFPSFDQPTVLLLAGDYDLSAVPGLVGNPKILVVQATPELEWTLKDTAGQLKLAYREFGAPMDTLKKTVSDLPDFAAGSRDAEKQLRLLAQQAQLRLGFPQIAPLSSLSLAPLDEVDWVAMRLWVVVPSDLLEFLPVLAIK